MTTTTTSPLAADATERAASYVTARALNARPMSRQVVTPTRAVSAALLMSDTGERVTLTPGTLYLVDKLTNAGQRGQEITIRTARGVTHYVTAGAFRVAG